MKYIYSLILCLTPFFIMGQKQANNWIIDLDTYISFNTGFPELITPPPATECAFNANWEAGYCDFFFTGYCGSTISDSAGNLLLYSNGEVVWNTQFDTIQYGDVFMGNMYSDQCLLLPRPRHPDRYYLITTPFLNYLGGARWSEIDIAANNGIGSTVQPWNNILLNNTTQKVSAVYHKNGRDIWIMLHQFNSDAFCAYLLTENGINTSPVVSNVGSMHENQAGNSGEDWGGAGEMKLSPNGKKLAVAIRGLDKFEVFDFDNETGIVSNPVSISGIDGAASVAFSSNSTVLYVGNEPTDIFVDSDIYQVDLLAGDSLAITNSLDTISLGVYSNYWAFVGYIQLAPDGKVYLACGYEDTIRTIDNPNIVGIGCNYNYQSFVIPPSYCGHNDSKQMLPTFFCSFLDRNILFKNQCFGDSTLICTQTNEGFDSIRWEFEDPIGTINSFTNIDTIFHEFTEPGNYEIVLKRYRNGFEDETDKMLYIHPVVDVTLGNDTTICEGAELSVGATGSFVQFAWVNDFSTDTIFANTANLTEAGNWWPTLTNFDEYCGTLDTINISLFPDSLEIGNDTVACINNLLVLDASLSNASYSWSTGDTTAQITANDNGFYMVTVQQGSCTFSDTILIAYDEPLSVNLFDTTIICDSIPESISAGDFNADFFWLPNGETTADILVTSPGSYSVTASNGCGDFVDSTVAINVHTPNVNLGNDTHICIGDTLQLGNLSMGAYEPASYTWSTGEVSQLIEITQANTYTLTLSNDCGTAIDNIIVETVDTPLINLGNDTTICLGDPFFLSTTTSVYNTYLWSTGESSTSITVYDAGQYSLSVTNACGTYSDSLLLATHENTFAFPFDTLWLHMADSIDAGSGYTTYLWWNGSTTQSIAANDSGLHWVEVTDSMGCNGSDSVWVNFLDGISSPSSLSGINVFPNPVKDELIIEFGSTDYKSAPAFRLWNSLGQEVTSSQTEGFAQSETFGKVILDTSALPKGIYLLSISQGNEKTVVKVVKK